MAICVGVALLETWWAAGADPALALRALKQPQWSPPLWGWAIIGVSWYAICLVGLARTLALKGTAREALVLLLVVMLLNAAAGLLQFSLGRLDLAFWMLAPYWLILLRLLWVLWPLDRVLFGLFSAYAFYLIYGSAWTWTIWRLNT